MRFTNKISPRLGNDILIILVVTDFGETKNDGVFSLKGYIHIHEGIHGVADLDPATADWGNPVAEVTVSSGY